MNVRQIILDHLKRVDTLRRDGKTGGKGKLAAQNRHISRAAGELDERLHLVNFEVVSQTVERAEKGEQVVNIAKELTEVATEIERLQTFKGRIAQKKKPELTRLSSRHATLLAARLYFDALKFERNTVPNAKINTVLTRTQGYNMDLDSWADSKTSSSLLEWMPEVRQFDVLEDEPSWGNSRDGMVESAAATKLQTIAKAQKASAVKGKRKQSSAQGHAVGTRDGEDNDGSSLNQLLSIDEDKALHEHFGDEGSFGTQAFMVTGPDGTKAADGAEYQTSMENFSSWLEAQVSRQDKAVETALIAEAKERSELKALKNTWSPLPLILPEIWLPVQSDIDKQSDAGAVRHNVIKHFDMSSPSPDTPYPTRLARMRRDDGEDSNGRELTTAFLPPGSTSISSHPRSYGDQAGHLTPSITSAERGRPLSPSLPSISVLAPSNTGSNANNAIASTVSPVAATLIESVAHGIEMTTAANLLVSLRDQASGSRAQEQNWALRVRALPRRVGATDFAHNTDATPAAGTMETESESSPESLGEETQDMDWEAS
ncbi:hypothetical protein KC343_g791 [Hortaea werneckii]|nr:hypothetical protein KC352_g9015 [Hortaea werneckii]KAI7572332.1 hypothetical protein KC317_g859 [Hortaea werneckii]KAI7627425.1 hypothetical protein KC346_g749 [Hortaea werneckii]KAI7637301.1 hypothetical protein KC343_g791 [Hortaea werneckii]KAI7682815.1 hypothetical protein KC319_g802 [Hortaea werneckii]